MLELKIKAGSRYVAPHALREAIGTERALREIGDMIEYLMAELDMIEGDPELECNGDLEPDGDGQGDIAWIEWSGRAGRHHGPHETMAWRPWSGLMHEDDEEDDPSGQCDEDGVNTSVALLKADVGPGCEISDVDMAVDDRGCDEEGGEPLPILDWREDDQSISIEPDPGADRRIMAVYRDRIRQASYVRMESRWPGQPPVWRPAGEPLRALNTN